MQIFEKYRPATFEEVLGQKRAIQQINYALQSGWGGKAYWISGSSGTGKTTLARIIASVGADKFYIDEYDSADDINTATLNNIDRAMHLYGGFGKSGRVYLINEAHGLKNNIIRKLLGMLERIPSHVVFIFTTTKTGQADLFDDKTDANPLLSRCIQIELTNQGLANVFAERAKQIAALEGLDGKPLQRYIDLVKTERNNMRSVLQTVARGAMKK